MMKVNHLVCFLVDGVESVVARLRHSVEIVNVVRLLVAEAPGQEHELAVAVHVVVELDRVLVRAVNEPSQSLKFYNHHGGSLLALAN